ncbi:hypothetical protein INT48_007453 [Thamnidium elegans]|uniref:Uncharacterized protein n=1 Tax=Thamnidium elegans TaxID=101142 RepID=A0A8H7VYJ8_9FUNG|nr:hypothetical protein INT48_007453 [Thamnidium elegans]
MSAKSFTSVKIDTLAQIFMSARSNHGTLPGGNVAPEETMPAEQGSGSPTHLGGIGNSSVLDMSASTSGGSEVASIERNLAELSTEFQSYVQAFAAAR